MSAVSAKVEGDRIVVTDKSVGLRWRLTLGQLREIEAAINECLIRRHLDEVVKRFHAKFA
jgi:hypothetical protein